MTWIPDGLTRWTAALAGGERRRLRPSPGNGNPPDGALTRFLWDLLLHPAKLWDRIWGALTDWLGAAAPLAIATGVILAAMSLVAVASSRSGTAGWLGTADASGSSRLRMCRPTGPPFCGPRSTG